MNNLRKYTASLALLFALFAVNGSEFFHHHENDDAHSANNCEACFFKDVLITASLQGDVFITNPDPGSHEYFYSESCVLLTEPENCSLGRAPPEASHF